MKVYKPSDLGGKSRDFITKVYKKGYSTGWKGLDEYYTVKLGGTTYLNGIGGHGKSVFLSNLHVNLSRLHGLRHLIFSPETGDPEEVLVEYIHTWSEKPPNSIEAKYFYNNTIEMDPYFKFLELKEDELSPDKFAQAWNEYAEHFDTITLDPWNEFFHDFKEFSGREDKYLEHWLGSFRRKAKETNTHLFLAAHPKPKKTKDGATMVPSLYDFSGGGAWHSRAMNVLCPFRPDVSDEGKEYPYHNQTDIIIQKVKPKYIGKKGQICLYLDVEKNRFYEEINGLKTWPCSELTGKLFDD